MDKTQTQIITRLHEMYAAASNQPGLKASITRKLQAAGMPLPSKAGKAVSEVDRLIEEYKNLAAAVVPAAKTAKTGSRKNKTAVPAATVTAATAEQQAA